MAILLVQELESILPGDAGPLLDRLTAVTKTDVAPIDATHDPSANRASLPNDSFRGTLNYLK
jgi:hypothetical protein